MAQVWSKEKVDRRMKSYYKKILRERFGGPEWMFIILAIGTIDDDIVTCVNEIIQHRLCTNAGRFQQKRSERETQEVHGIQHKVSYAKSWRSYCKQLDKRIHQEDLAWQQGRSRM